MQKKELKGYVVLAISLGIVFSACGPKETTAPPTPIPQQPIQSINPGDLGDINIPGFEDDLGGDTGVDTGNGTDIGDGTDTGVDTGDGTDTGDTTTDTGDTTVDPTPTPEATETATATPEATPTPTDEPDPTPTPEPTCNATIQGDLNVIAGQSRELTGKIECSDGSTKTGLTWTSSDTTIATVDTNGKVTGVKAGEVDITATYTTNTSVTVTKKFKVNASCGITIQGDPNIYIGSEKQYIGNVTCSDGSTSTNVEWSSSDTSVATVTTTGGVVKGLKEGTATITAKYVVDKTQTTKIDVSIQKAPDPKGNDILTPFTHSELNDPTGIDVRNGNVYVAYKDIVNTDEGAVKIFNGSGSQAGDIKGAFLSALPLEFVGVASDGSRVWILNRVPYGSSGYNLYSFTVSSDGKGTDRRNQKIGSPNGTDFRDLAIFGNVIYAIDGRSNSVIKVPYDSTGARTENQNLNYITGINPAGLGVDSFGNLFVVNAGTNPPTISKYNTNGEKVLEFNTRGKNATGPLVSAIGDVTFDPREGGFVYVLGTVNGANVVLRYDANGNYQRMFGQDSGIQEPKGIAVSTDGHVYVTDKAKNLVHVFSPGIK